MASHEPYTRIAKVNGKPAIAIPMVTVPEDDLRLVLGIVAKAQALMTGHVGRRTADANELTAAIARLRRAIGKKG